MIGFETTNICSFAAHKAQRRRRFIAQRRSQTFGRQIPVHWKGVTIF